MDASSLMTSGESFGSLLANNLAKPFTLVSLDLDLTSKTGGADGCVEFKMIVSQIVEWMSDSPFRLTS